MINDYLLHICLPTKDTFSKVVESVRCPDQNPALRPLRNTTLYPVCELQNKPDVLFNINFFRGKSTHLFNYFK